MASISIFNHEVPYDSHDYYDVTIDDDEILTLVTTCPDMVDSWISEIYRIHRRRLHRLIVGLDVEWRPNFNRSSPNPVATLQLCVGRRCLIFQIIHAPEYPQSLTDFLNEESFTFVGVGIDSDVAKLTRDYNLEVYNTVDLRDLAVEEMEGRPDLRNAGLRVLAREVLGTEIHKPRNITLSRWDSRWLTPSQVQYACMDAFISFEIGRYLYS